MISYRISLARYSASATFPSLVNAKPNIDFPLDNAPKFRREKAEKKQPVPASEPPMSEEAERLSSLLAGEEPPAAVELEEKITREEIDVGTETLINFVDNLNDSVNNGVVTFALIENAGAYSIVMKINADAAPNAMMSASKDTIFTNVALTEDGDVWWEGIGYDAPGTLIDWKGNKWDAATATEKAAHPNARFTAKASNCPAIAPEWEDPAGVPISAFLFGGRRPSTVPLVHQSNSWEHGVFMGSIVGSEVTAAALDVKAGTIRRDPFAMLPFCGYHMADYFKHWLEIGEKSTADKLPKIFYVNWFRKTADGKWLWPGFGDNSRVLKWIFERCNGTGKAVETPIGFMPTVDAIDRTGLEDEVTAEDMAELLSLDKEGWLKEVESIKEHYAKFGDRMPKALYDQLAALEARLNA